MSTFVTKIKSFFSKFKLELIVLGIVFLIFNFILLINGAFPYGKNTLLVSDSFALIGVIFEHIFDFLAGETGLIYNVRIGGGAELLSMMLYMIFNPFFLLVLPFGKANIFRSFNLVIFVVLIFNAIVVMWFIKKHFKNLSKFMFIVISLAYIFCSYLIISLATINWLTFPSIILFVIDGFLKLENDGKILPFAISIIFSVINSFVVGIASNIVLLMLFIGHIIITKEKEEQKNIFVKLLFAYIIAVLVSLCLMLPTILGILKTNRANSIIDNIFKLDFKISFMFKLGIFCLDIFLLIFAIYYLVVCDKTKKESKFFIFATIVVFVPSIFDGSLNLLFGGYYSGFPGRIQFLNTALMLVLVCKLFNEKSPLKKEVQENEIKSSKLFLSLYILMITICILAVVFYGIFQLSKLAITIKSPVGSSDSVYIVVVLMTAIFAILFLCVLLGKKRKVLSGKVVRFNIYFTIIFSLIVNVLLTSFELNTDTKDYVNVKEITSINNVDSKLKIISGEFEGVHLSNSIFEGGTLNMFTSTISAENSAISNLGYFKSQVSVSTDNGTIIADSLAGHRYFITKKQMDRPYLNLIDEKEGIYLYENTLATTGAILLDKETNFDTSKNILENFEDLANSFNISEKLFDDVSVTISKVEGISELYVKNVYKCSYTAPYDGVLYLKNAAIHEQGLTGIKEYVSKEVDSNEIYSCESCSAGQTDVGYVKSGEETVFYLINVEEISDVKFTFLNYGVAENLCERLKDSEVEIDYIKNGYKVGGTAKANQKLFVFMANVQGMQYLLNNKNVTAGTVLDGFVMIDVQAGEFTLQAEYKYPHAKIWIIVTALCLILLIAISLIYKFTGFKHIKGFTRGAFMVIGAGVLSVFVIFGILLTFFKIIV